MEHFVLPLDEIVHLNKEVEVRKLSHVPKINFLSIIKENKELHTLTKKRKARFFKVIGERSDSLLISDEKCVFFSIRRKA